MLKDFDLELGLGVYDKPSHNKSSNSTAIIENSTHGLRRLNHSHSG